MIQLGQEAKDKISGFKGICTARTEFFHGCIRILLTPTKLSKEGDLQEGYWFDEPQLIPQKKGKKAKIGGPGAIPPRRNNDGARKDYY